MNTLKTILAIILTAVSCYPSHADEIKLAGSITSITTVFSPIQEAYETSTGDTLTIQIMSDAAQSLIALERGEVDMASINGLSFDDLLAKAKKQGLDINPATLKKTEVTTSRLIILVHKSNKIKQLSKEQLKAIFTGKITNWHGAGGDELPIKVYWGQGTPYLNKPFTEWVLDGEKVTARAKPAGDHFSLREIVLKDPGAIVLSSSGLITPSTKAPDIPVMKLPMVVITKGEPSAKILKLLKYHREEFGYMDE